MTSDFRISVKPPHCACSSELSSSSQKAGVRGNEVRKSGLEIASFAEEIFGFIPAQFISSLVGVFTASLNETL